MKESLLTIEDVEPGMGEVGFVSGSHDGPLFDLLLGIRALGGSEAERGESPVAVVALDGRSLDAPELASSPRAMLSPVWAATLEGLFQAGARAVAFDFIFLYNANRLIPNYDAPFLGALHTYRDRVVLARSSQRLPRLRRRSRLHRPRRLRCPRRRW